MIAIAEGARDHNRSFGGSFLKRVGMKTEGGVFLECLGEFEVRKHPKGELEGSCTRGEDTSKEIPGLPTSLGRRF